MNIQDISLDEEISKLRGKSPFSTVKVKGGIITGAIAAVFFLLMHFFAERQPNEPEWIFIAFLVGAVTCAAVYTYWAFIRTKTLIENGVVMFAVVKSCSWQVYGFYKVILEYEYDDNWHSKILHIPGLIARSIANKPAALIVVNPEAPTHIDLFHNFATSNKEARSVLFRQEGLKKDRQ